MTAASKIYHTLPELASPIQSLSFLTDIEGNWDYFRKLLQTSRCFASKSEVDASKIHLKENTMLIYGGDLGDKGTATLRLYETFVDLKKRYPDRVVLLAGNRDINKMRFTSELMDDRELNIDAMAKETRDGPSWIEEDKRITLLDFLEKLKEIKNDDKSGYESVNTKVNRLQWILNHTMGSLDDFSRRRQELARLYGNDTGLISDDCVLQSYISSVLSGGVIREYLTHAQLAFIAKDTLFVHGGIFNGENGGLCTITALGHIPGQPEKSIKVREWVEQLNQWYQDQLFDWIQNPFWDDGHVDRGGSQLLRYVQPDYHASVVMGRHLDKKGLPVQIPTNIAKRLVQGGIKRLIVGHTPHGNCPTVIPQLDNSAFEHVIMADTSYSDTNAHDNRGDAASEVALTCDVNGDGWNVLINGVLPDRRNVVYRSHCSDFEWIGRSIDDGTFIKAKLRQEGANCLDDYLLCTVENRFNFKYSTRSKADIAKMFQIA